MIRSLSRINLVLCFFLTGGAWAVDQKESLAKPLKVAMLQINPVVGDFQGTLKKVIEGYERAVAEGADLALTPEGVLPGYPAWDMVIDDFFIERADEAVALLRGVTRGKKTALVVGHLTFNPKERGRKLVNAASVFENGKMIFQQTKMLLPTYSVFDDARYFEPATSTKILFFRGYRIGLRICEDWWFNDKLGGRSIYHKDPIQVFRTKGVDLGIALSWSPYHREKVHVRELVHAGVVKSLGAPFIYVNAIGGVDQVQADGNSFVMDAQGQLVGRLGAFVTDFEVVQIEKGKTPQLVSNTSGLAPRAPAALLEEELVLQALIQGLREYMSKTGMSKVVFGFSGGLDSSIVAAISSLAIGPENVIGIMMPSEFSSDGSINDSIRLAQNLGIPKENLLKVPIKNAYEALVRTFQDSLRETQVPLNGKDFVPYENIQARLRMIIEHFVTNQVPGALKLNTSDKSEISVGYSSMYGDASGGLSLIGDLYKTDAKNLGRYINERAGRELVPWEVLSKKPSAELRPGQVTENEIPDYEVIDPLLRDLVEHGLSPEELRLKYQGHAAVEALHGSQWVDKILRLYQNSEWKRLQLPPSIKVSSRAFGLYGRRVPVTGIKFQDVIKKVSCQQSLKD